MNWEITVSHARIKMHAIPCQNRVVVFYSHKVEAKYPVNFDGDVHILFIFFFQIRQ